TFDAPTVCGCGLADVLIARSFDRPCAVARELFSCRGHKRSDELCRRYRARQGHALTCKYRQILSVVRPGRSFAKLASHRKLLGKREAMGPVLLEEIDKLVPKQASRSSGNGICENCIAWCCCQKSLHVGGIHCRLGARDKRRAHLYTAGSEHQCGCDS